MWKSLGWEIYWLWTCLWVNRIRSTRIFGGGRGRDMEIEILQMIWRVAALVAVDFAGLHEDGLLDCEEGSWDRGKNTRDGGKKHKGQEKH